MRLILAAMTLAALAGAARADFVASTYTEKAKSWEEQSEAVLDVFDIRPDQRDAARNAAYGWFSLGPCQAAGDGDELQTAAMISASEDQELRAAYYAVIGQLSAQHFGRSPDADICQFVRDHTD